MPIEVPPTGGASKRSLGETAGRRAPALLRQVTEEQGKLVGGVIFLVVLCLAGDGT